jgi:hypothetical protein
MAYEQGSIAVAFDAFVEDARALHDTEKPH